jgi:hypothetical protein
MVKLALFAVNSIFLPALREARRPIRELHFCNWPGVVAFGVGCRAVSSPSFFAVLQGFEEWRKARKKAPPVVAARAAE